MLTDAKIDIISKTLYKSTDASFMSKFVYSLTNCWSKFVEFDFPNQNTLIVYGRMEYNSSREALILCLYQPICHCVFALALLVFYGITKLGYVYISKKI